MMKIVLAVCLLQIALCWDDWEKMGESEHKFAWMMMMKGQGGHDEGDNSKYDHKPEWSEPKPEWSEHDKEDMKMHFDYVTMMKKKEEAKKAEFAKFMKHYKEMKEKKEWAEKHKAMELFQKHTMLKERTKQLEEVEDMMKSFTEKKHEFVFHLTSNFLKLCKCGEVTTQITRFFTMEGGSDMMEDMIDQDAVRAMQTGDNLELAKIFKKMSHDEQKALFFKGLIRSMCAGAKTFVQFSKQFEETYLKGDDGTTTTKP